MALVAVFLAVSLLLTSAGAVGDIMGNVDSFPGWLDISEETRKPQSPIINKKGIDMSKVIQLSEKNPRAYLYQGFLTEKECDHIVRKAKPRLMRSAVTDNHSGRSLVDNIRTSSGTFMAKGEDPIIKRIEERIMEWTFLPIENQEALQVLRYTKGQEYGAHHDYFHDPINVQRGGHRYATVLTYLNNVTKGGETTFPMKKDPTPKDDSWSDCAMGVLAAKPRKGDAVLFFDMHPDGSPDEYSLHHACPVIEGEKWSAPMWIHVAPFNSIYHYAHEDDDTNGCRDQNGMCAAWAQEGECDTNTRYMHTACKKSCKKC